MKLAKIVFDDRVPSYMEGDDDANIDLFEELADAEVEYDFYAHGYFPDYKVVIVEDTKEIREYIEGRIQECTSTIEKLKNKIDNYKQELESYDTTTSN